MKPNHFDAIVIGSGMGGLTTASLLAQFSKKRVLVLERHFKLGGFTHSFRRKKYEWDVGVHYVGGMQRGAMTRQMMDLVTRGGVKWHQMKSPFERFMFPQGSFDVSDDADKFCNDLIQRFPAEEKNIREYFVALRRAQRWMSRWFVSKQYGAWISNALTWIGKGLASQTTGDYLNRFQDPFLKAILAGQWPDYGTPPSESAFGIHATVAADYLHGGFYPIGGSKQIALHAVQAIEDAGGLCLVNHEVKSLDIVKGRVCGVTAVNKGQEISFKAPIVISNAGAPTTFGSLVPEAYCTAERVKVARLKTGTSANILFLGLNDDPKKHGFDDCNYWIYSGLDHDCRASHSNEMPMPVEGVFVSFGSLRNPGQEPHTAQIIFFTDVKPWQAFANSEWLRRGASYDQAKSELAEELLQYVERQLPGFRKLVEFQELATPLTVKSFTGHRGGAIYGQACDPNRITRDRWDIGTSLPGLYLTGSDVGTPGINGAMMAGVMTAAKLLGPLGLPYLFMKAARQTV